MSGSNQHWFSFKSTLVEHFRCSLIRSGGQEHFNAKQYAIKEKRRVARNTEVNTNLVSAAVEVCKMKSAASHYENMIGFLSFCGADVGYIGHGR